MCLNESKVIESPPTVTSLQTLWCIHSYRDSFPLAGLTYWKDLASQCTGKIRSPWLVYHPGGLWASVHSHDPALVLGATFSVITGQSLKKQLARRLILQGFPHSKASLQP